MNRKRHALKLLKRDSAPQAPASRTITSVRGPIAGRLEGVTPEGRLLVSWGDPTVEPAPAWIATSTSARALLDAAEARGPVLLDFLDGDPGRPVILALLRERLAIERPTSGVVMDACVEIHAAEALSLECGKSSIVLHEDGRVTIRGTHVESLSTGANKIKGASVGIN